MNWQLAIVAVCVVWAAWHLLTGVRRWLKRDASCGGCEGGGCGAPNAGDDSEPLIRIDSDPARR